MKFKVHDFVRNITTCEILALDLSLCHELNKDNKDFVLWVPNKGEWCWFYNDDETGENLSFGQFKSMTGSYYNAMVEMKEHIVQFFYCEPFVNRLPLVITNKRKNK